VDEGRDGGGLRGAKAGDADLVGGGCGTTDHYDGAGGDDHAGRHRDQAGP
jgi:hypothetical protein